MAAAFTSCAIRLHGRWMRGALTVTVAYGNPFGLDRCSVPAYGSVIDSPTYVAFRATRYNGIECATPTLFTARSLEGKPLTESLRVRVCHGFGDAYVRRGGKAFEVGREAVVSVKWSGKRVRPGPYTSCVQVRQMTFFSKLKNAAEQLADAGSKQVEILKLQGQLGQVETELERNYAEAGKRARELYRRKELLDLEMGVIMERIDGLEDRIQELRGQVQELQQASAAPPSPAPATPAAQADTPPTAPAAPTGPVAPTIPQVQSPTAQAPAAAPQVYRPPVAAPAPGTEVEPGAPAPDVLCPECGKLIPAEARFCEHCGTKLASE